MADDMNNSELDNTVSSAADAIADILRAEKEPAPAQAAQPEPKPDSPEPEPTPAAVEGNAATEGAPDAPVVETKAPEVKPDAKQPTISPELETRLAEAAKKTQEAETARNQYVNTLNVLVPQLEAQIKGEFKDIKSVEDLIALADPRSPNYNPERYNAANAAFMRLNAANQARAQVQAEQQRVEGERLQGWRTEQEGKIAELIPELTDPDKGPSLARKLKAYAQEAGYTPQQLSNASAVDTKMLYDAMRFRDSQAERDTALAAAKNKAKDAPSVQKPGSPTPGTSKDQKAMTDYARLQKNHSVDAAADVFAHIF